MLRYIWRRWRQHSWWVCHHVAVLQQWPSVERPAVHSEHASNGSAVLTRSKAPCAPRPHGAAATAGEAKLMLIVRLRLVELAPAFPITERYFNCAFLGLYVGSCCGADLTLHYKSQSGQKIPHDAQTNWMTGMSSPRND